QGPVLRQAVAGGGGGSDSDDLAVAGLYEYRLSRFKAQRGDLGRDDTAGAETAVETAIGIVAGHDKVPRVGIRGAGWAGVARDHDFAVALQRHLGEVGDGGVGPVAERGLDRAVVAEGRVEAAAGVEAGQADQPAVIRAAGRHAAVHDDLPL